MKKTINRGSPMGRELFKKSELESALPRRTATVKGEGQSSFPRRGAIALDLLISRAKSPCKEKELFELKSADETQAPGYRFNFYGGIVR